MEDKIENVCIRCGGCCRGGALEYVEATSTDLRRWCKQKRYDIIKYFPYGLGSPITPLTKNKPFFERCPFLRRVSKGFYECTIHDTKPEACRDSYCGKHTKQSEQSPV